MNYGLYLSASGVLTNMYRQDVFANNLANVNTTAFKPDVPAIHHRAPEAIEDGRDTGMARHMLEMLGGGVLAGPQRINFTPGSLHPSGNELDVALTDKNKFFVVQTQNPDGELTSALTRDGRFTTDSQGRLTTQTGEPVLGIGGGPITIPPGGAVRIGPDGSIVRDGEALGQILVTNIQQTQKLQKIGSNRFTMPGQNEFEAVEQPGVKSGFVEASSVDSVKALMSMINATKAAQGNARMIQYHDLLMDKAVNTLGRVG